MSQQFRHEDRRGPRFEGATVTAKGAGVYDVQANGRAAGWSQVGEALDLDLQTGGSVLLLCQGDSDVPLAVGANQWIT